MPLNRNSSNVGCLGLLVPNKTRQEPKILRVGSDGCIYDQHGILHGRLTAGVLKYCVGREVNHDGLVIDRKGRLLGIVQTVKQLESKKSAAQSAAQSEKLSVEGHEDDDWVFVEERFADFLEPWSTHRTLSAPDRSQTGPVDDDFVLV